MYCLVALPTFLYSRLLPFVFIFGFALQSVFDVLVSAIFCTGTYYCSCFKTPFKTPIASNTLPYDSGMEKYSSTFRKLV